MGQASRSTRDQRFGISAAPGTSPHVSGSAEEDSEIQVPQLVTTRHEMKKRVYSGRVEASGKWRRAAGMDPMTKRWQGAKYALPVQQPRPNLRFPLRLRNDDGQRMSDRNFERHLQG